MFNGQPPGVYMPGYARANNAHGMAIEKASAVAGTEIEGVQDHLDAVRETEAHAVKCVRDYRNRLKKIIRFWKDHYPEYYISGGVKVKKDRKHYSFEHVRKFHDAILYVSKLANEELPHGYLSLR